MAPAASPSLPYACAYPRAPKLVEKESEVETETESERESTPPPQHRDQTFDDAKEKTKANTKATADYRRLHSVDMRRTGQCPWPEAELEECPDPRPPSPTSSPPRCTAEPKLCLCEVRRHNHRQSCWLVANQRVYDITPVLMQHPGGVCCLLRKAGGADCTEDMNFHTGRARKQLEQYCIGKLQPCGEVVEGGGDGGLLQMCAVM